MRSLAALLLVLAGCSDPSAPVESGAFWLIEVGDHPFWDGEGTPLLLSSPERTEEREGAVFWIGARLRDVLLKRVKEGREGPLRETGRFDVPADREVRCAVDGVFELRFTATRSLGERVVATYRLEWSGRMPLEGRQSFSTLQSTSGFLRPKGGGRYDLLMFAVNELRP